MSVKTTVKLDRAEADNRYADLIVKHGNPHYFIYKVIRDWEDYLLEEMNDQANGGEGFENYKIVEEDDEKAGRQDP